MIIKFFQRIVSWSFILFICFTAFDGIAQNVIISGFIEDEGSSERLIGVSIYTPNRVYGTTTNNYGFFSITIPLEIDTVLISYIGFKTAVYINTKNKSQEITIKLAEARGLLNEVVVEDKADPISVRVQMSATELNMEQLKTIPALFGEVDILRAIQYMPGVQSGGEGTTGIYVRGGGPDQNLILLDGVPVYNISHLFGFFSVFNADAIKSVELIKGGFPARYGGRLSSVIDISMKEGNMQSFHGAGSIGLIASKLTLEGPIVKDKTSFMISGRRTYIDAIAQPFIKLYEPGKSLGYFFTDVNAKVNHKFSRKDRLYLSYFTGYDKFYAKSKEEYNRVEYKDEANLKWGNSTGALRWNHIINPKMFLNTTATFTRYQLSMGQLSSSSGSNRENYTNAFKIVSNIRDWGLKADVDYLPNNKNHFRFGGNFIWHTYKPGAINITDQRGSVNADSIVTLSPELTSYENYFYIENEQKITNRLALNYGLNAVQYFVAEKSYFSFQPRISGRYLLTNKLSVKASFARMEQYLHLLSGNTGIGLPSDLWVPVTKNIPPMRADQTAAGVAFNTIDGKWEISVEGYYKKMTGLIEYAGGTSFANPNNWENKVVKGGQGWAYGIELFVQKKMGKTTGWIGYTLSWNNRQFDDLNNGKKYPYRYDRRHDISVVFTHKFSEKFDVGFTWVFGTGISTNVAQFQAAGLTSGNYGSTHIYDNFSERNSFQFGSYHRADIGFNWHKKKKWGERTWNVSFYNLYNRQNPFYMYLDEDDFGKKSFIQVSLFPILPSVSYIFKF